jgi:hypothetical protein
MTRAKLSELPINELKARATQVKVTTWMSTALLLLFWGYLCYSSIRAGKEDLASFLELSLPVPAALISLVMLNLSGIKRIDSEIRSRSQLKQESI